MTEPNGARFDFCSVNDRATVASTFIPSFLRVRVTENDDAFRRYHVVHGLLDLTTRTRGGTRGARVRVVVGVGAFASSDTRQRRGIAQCASRRHGSFSDAHG